MNGAVAPLIIERASTDPRFSDHPGLALLGIESYIAVPLHRPDGTIFGTLCALDPAPGTLPDAHLKIFRMLARLIALQLEERDERAERERFIGALAHDLRSPLQTISTVAGFLSQEGAAHVARMGERLTRSVTQMNDMTGSILDFARSRLGSGLPCQPGPGDLAETTRNAIESLDVAAGRIRLRIEGDPHATFDQSLITRLLQNLLRNALEHGEQDRPIDVLVAGDESDVVIEVANQGPTIPAAILPYVFQPFRRGADSRGPGLGLGLYIASEICAAHGGGLEVESSGDRTRFRARWPRSPLGICAPRRPELR